MNTNTAMANTYNISQFTTLPNEKKFLTADDVADILGISKSTAYRIIKNLNDELKEKRKITVAGKISSKYFYENAYL